MDSVAQMTAMDDTVINTSPVDHVSLTLSLPYEMIEAILVHLSVPELLLAAPNIPKSWRDVIESSRQIWKSIARYDYDDEHIIVKKRFRKWPRPSSDRLYTDVGVTVRCFLLGGQLFIHHGPLGNDGFIFAPGREELPLKILDPHKSILRSREGVRLDQWSIELYDLDGTLICFQDLKWDSKIVMGRFLRVVHEHHMPESDEDSVRAKRRKRGRL